jgi:pimeloyl-ACP methyl ester carboxylesterase
MREKVLRRAAMRVIGGFTLASSLLLQAGCGESDTPGQGGLDWGSCPSAWQLEPTPGMECATLEVPLNPAAASGETIELALNRIRATGDRLGALLINPGGPGASGIAAMAYMRESLPAEVRARFDVIGFDPRGIGRSAPITCALPDDRSLTFGFADTPAEIEQVVERAELQTAACVAEYGAERLSSLSTVNVARDMDLIRVALGEEQLSYFGTSYGTRLGMVYAELFPERVRSLVLDANVDPSGTLVGFRSTQVASFSATFDAFVAACAAAQEACAIGPDAATTFDALVARTEAEFVRVPGDVRRLNSSDVVAGVSIGLYQEALWPIVVQGIADAEAGDGSILMQLADATTQRRQDGTFGTNLLETNAAVNCADFSDRVAVADVPARAAEALAAHPRWGGLAAGLYAQCAAWPVSSSPVPEIDPQGLAPALVVGSVGDPATPFAWSEAMAMALPGAVLVTYEGATHGAVSVSPCVKEAVAAYLIDGTLPAAGLRCSS